MFKFISLFLLNFFLAVYGWSQPPNVTSPDHSMAIPGTVLRPGDTIPASIWQNIPRQENTQLVIFDFWHLGCPPCLAGFPKMVALQKEFGDRIQVVLVNSWEDSTKIRERLTAVNKKRKQYGESLLSIPSELPSLTGDTILKNLIGITYLPGHAWFSGSGKFIYATEGHQTNSASIREYLQGTIPAIGKKNLKAEGVDPSRGLYLPAHLTITPEFSSGIFAYNPGLNSSTGSYHDTARQSFTRVYLNTTISQLFQYATRFKRIILNEVNDKSVYIWPDAESNEVDINDWYRRNLYSYQVTASEKYSDLFYKLMLDDLNRFFSAERKIEGVATQRKFIQYELISIKDPQYKAKGGPEEVFFSDSLVRLRNSNISNLRWFLQQKFNHPEKGKLFADKTGIPVTISVDLELYGALHDFRVLNRQLKRYGLQLRKTRRMADVLVIRDLP